MGRSVSYPSGAIVAFTLIEVDDEGDWDFEYEWLRADLSERAGKFLTCSMRPLPSCFMIPIDGFHALYNPSVMERLDCLALSMNLDAVFAALADPTRRAILSRLAGGEASVNEIAAPFKMSQPAVSRHLRVLERAGLIERDVDRQRRPARLKAEPMAAAADWIEGFRTFWSGSFDQLDGLLEELKVDEKKGHRE